MSETGSRTLLVLKPPFPVGLWAGTVMAATCACSENSRDIKQELYRQTEAPPGHVHLA